MRELKFRVWVDDYMDYLDLNDFAFREYIISSDVIILQYTGLKDRLGQEVYEGDLLKMSTPGKLNDSFYKIIFENGCFLLQDTKFPLTKVVFSSMLENKVVGNIYENPKLLQESII